MIERYFELRERRTTIRREVLAGITTFMTMAYILFVNPSILTAIPDTDGLKLAPSAVLTSTAIVAAVATFAMGIFANVPIALASGMGLNAVVAFQLVGPDSRRSSARSALRSRWCSLPWPESCPRSRRRPRWSSSDS
jgi:adenine/guanine/hypoxanthine permease